MKAKAKQNNTLVSWYPADPSKMGPTLVLFMHKQKKITKKKNYKFNIFFIILFIM